MREENQEKLFVSRQIPLAGQSGNMKCKIQVLVFLWFVAISNALSQGSFGAADLRLDIKFQRILNPAENNQPSGSANYFGRSTLFTSSNTLQINIQLHQAPATGGRVLQKGAGEVWTNLLELAAPSYSPGFGGTNILGGPGLNFITNIILPYIPPHYLYTVNFHPAVDQMKSLLNGELYVEVDFGGGRYLGQLLPVISTIRSPLAKFTISPRSQFSSDIDIVVISSNNRTAKVLLDGSSSADYYYLPLQYTWWDGGAPFAATVKTNIVFKISSHQISLRISDGVKTDTFTKNLNVISPADAVGKIIAMVGQTDLQRNTQINLNHMLLNAAQSLDQGRRDLGVRHLLAFQNWVRFTVARNNTAEAEILHEAAQEIIDALNVL